MGSEAVFGTVGSDTTHSGSTPLPVRSVPFARPHIDDEDIAAVVDVLRSGWITTGPRVQELEASFARRLGARHAIAVNSATAALHLALEAAGVTAGDEVIVPDITFTATAEVVRYLNATPVLVDVEPDTLCICPTAIERAMTSRTRAVIPVHLGGHPANMDAIMAIADTHELAVIEDSAHALPAFSQERPAGTIGHFGAFSFYATKTITSGEGGMLITNDDRHAERARTMALHGMSRDAWKRYTPGGSWRYDVLAPGFKYNMPDTAAALALSQLRKVDYLWEQRRTIARLYTDLFANIREIECPHSRSDVEHSWHLYAIRLHLDRLRSTRDGLIEYLAGRGVGTSVHFIPLHTFTYYRSLAPHAGDHCPVAAGEFERMISLPIYPGMTEEDVEYVATCVCSWVEANRC